MSISDLEHHLSELLSDDNHEIIQIICDSLSLEIGDNEEIMIRTGLFSDGENVYTSPDFFANEDT